MQPQTQTSTPQQKKSPPEGQPFSGLETAALAAKGLGLLLLASAVLGFGFSLIRAATSYSAIVNSGQASAEVFFIVLATYLGTFTGLAILGGLLFGVGVWLERRSARPGPAAKKAKK